MATTVVENFIQAIKNEKDPQKVIEIWSLATKTKNNPNLTLKDIILIHETCNKEITNAALSLGTIDFE